MTTGLNQVLMAQVPVEAGPWYTQANEHMNNGNYDQALQLYDKIIVTSPTCAMALHNKGNCLDQLGKLDAAIQCYDQAIEIDPYDAESWFNKSMSLRKLGKTGDASYCADKAIDLAMGR
jgi:tetratricopeptide (TPR) repeat protein